MVWDDRMYTWRDEPTVDRHLDFSDCGTLLEVHEQIRKELQLPRWYGQNLDALWDSLTGIMAIPADVTIVYRPQTKAAEKLRPDILEIVEVFQEAQDQAGVLTLHVEM